MMQRPKVKIITPLTVGSAVLVAALAAVMMVLEPEDLWAWLVVMLFLPAAIVGLVIMTRRTGSHDRAPKISGGLRAALVGAGVLLATALAFSVTDNLGLTGAEGQFTATPIMAILVALIATFVDFIGARLEHAAAKDPDTDKE